MKRTVSLLVALLAAVAVLIGPAPARADDGQLPVPYSFLPNAAFGGLPDADAPGTNDWSCRPSKAHPRPVVLVHGTLGNRSTNWQTYGPLLKNNGYCVYSLTYGVAVDVPPLNLLAGMADMRASAQELKTFVAKVLAATGAKKVDLIGHSQGTIMPQWYVRFLGGAKHVDNYISLASLWHGTSLSEPMRVFIQAFAPGQELPYCTACTQFATGADFVKRLRRGGVATKGVRYTNVVTKYDELVKPYTSGIETGMRNVVLQDICPTDFTEHFEIAADPNAAQVVLNTLDPSRAQRVTCAPIVLPFVGGLV